MKLRNHYKLFVILDVTERGVCLSYRKDKDFASGAQCKQVNSFQRRDWNDISYTVWMFKLHLNFFPKKVQNNLVTHKG
jgi:hypothetical protein